MAFDVRPANPAWLAHVDVANCTAQQTNCNGACVDLNVDTNNCGACGVTCAAGQTCNAGVCTASQACNPGTPCSTGLPGVCAPGIVSCAGGVPSCIQGSQPSAEICDGLDNNCNGQVDEGDLGGGLACTTAQPGVCSPGITSCLNGSIVCTRNVNPSTEVCNGLDDNCNGQVDEGNPGGGLACTTVQPGVCSPGTTSCTNGSIVCTRNVNPSTEVCNGLDDNCNGQIDEGNPGGGLACTTGQPGVCSPGITSCTNGSIVCARNVNPSTEVCNGLDDNCDGQIDEGNPGGGLACTTGLAGACANGVTSCTGGSLICVPPTGCQESSQAMSDLSSHKARSIQLEVKRK